MPPPSEIYRFATFSFLPQAGLLLFLNKSKTGLHGSRDTPAGTPQLTLPQELPRLAAHTLAGRRSFLDLASSPCPTASITGRPASRSKSSDLVPSATIPKIRPAFSKLSCTSSEFSRMRATNRSQTIQFLKQGRTGRVAQPVFAYEEAEQRRTYTAPAGNQFSRTRSWIDGF